MKRFAYKARDKAGKLLKGEVEADTEREAAKLLRDKGYVPTGIRVSGNIFGALRELRYKVTRDDVVTFTRQLATMITAGLPITDSLAILRSQSKPALQEVIGRLLADVEDGESFSKALSKHPKVFTPTYIALMKAGETGGVIEKVLENLADNLEKQKEFEGKVKGAMIYPAIVVIGMIIVSVVMVVFVTPKLTVLYEEFDAELPLPTKILLGISDAVIKFWPVLLGLLGLGVWGFGRYKKTPEGRRKVDEITLKIPIVGPLTHEIILTDLTRTLSMMITAGVSILEGLQVTAGVIKNTIVSDALKNVSQKIQKGFPIAYSFAQEPDAFPFILSQMVAVGEETGKMDDVLLKISHVFEVESSQKVKSLTAAIEPLIMIVLGIGVGFLVMSVILPIYKLTSQF